MLKARKYPDEVKFETIEGYIFENIKVIKNDYGVDEEVHFFLKAFEDGPAFILRHEQDCCEDVYLESIEGDINDLIGTPILSAEESSSDATVFDSEHDSATWTFYNIRTIKGSVTLRFFGSSNGYYSERVSCLQFFLKPGEE
jgi:hypothetical protein